MESKEFKKRETKSTYSINGRNFQINSYDPMVGNYILMQIVSQVMPMGLGNMLNQEFGTESIPSVGSASAPMMSKRDFIQLQVDILSTVYELYDTGEKSPVVRENGTYGVADVNMMMIMKLLIASLAFNFKDFFDAVPSLKGSIGGKISNLVNTKT